MVFDHLANFSDLLLVNRKHKHEASLTYTWFEDNMLSVLVVTPCPLRANRYQIHQLGDLYHLIKIKSFLGGISLPSIFSY